MMEKMKADVAVIAGVFLVAALFFCMIYFKDTVGAEVMIVQNGKVVECYSLLEDNTVPVMDEEGGFNLVLISNGTVRVCDADCPDKLCVKQKAISKGGESIICLPHKLVVQIMSKEESDLDAVTN